jgi:hypothetical protein
MMFVSSIPCLGVSVFISAAELMIGSRVLVSPERVKIGGRRIARHRGELIPRDETAAMPQRNQLANAMTVARDSEGLAPLDGVHDLSRPRSEVALRYLCRGHTTKGSTLCHLVLRAATDSDRGRC